MNSSKSKTRTNLRAVEQLQRELQAEINQTVIDTKADALARQILYQKSDKEKLLLKKIKSELKNQTDETE